MILTGLRPRLIRLAGQRLATVKRQLVRTVRVLMPLMVIHPLTGLLNGLVIVLGRPMSLRLTWAQSITLKAFVIAHGSIKGKEARMAA